jgi:hypothetical protein
MSAVALLLSVINAALCLLVLAGLIARQRVGACKFLVLYLVAGAALRVPVWLWPQHFYTWAYWFVTDVIETALELAIALELAWRIFGRLPNGLARSRRLHALLALATLTSFCWALPALLGHVPGSDEYYAAAVTLVSRITYGCAWFFAALLGLVFYHAVPTERLHRDVAGGFILWCVVFAWREELVAMTDGGTTLRSFVEIGISCIYSFVLVAWTATAWRRDRSTLLSPATIAFLRPWRA